MPHTTPQDVHVNQAITVFSVAYRQELTDYIATKFAPIIPSNKQSNIYFKYDKGDLLRNVAKVREPFAESEGTSVKLSTDGPFFCNVRAIHKDISFDTLANYDNPLNPKRSAARDVVQWLMTGLEIDWASAFFKINVWAVDWTGTASTSNYASGGTSFIKWDAANSDPLTDISYARRLIHSKTGKWPNKIAFSDDVWNILKNHTKMIDRIKYTQRGNITRRTTDIVADLMELDEVLIASAVYNSAAENATDVVTNIMSNGVLLGFVEPNPAPETATACCTFIWDDLFGAVQGEPQGMGMRMLDFPIIHRKLQRIEGEMPYDLKVIGSDLGLFMTSVIG